MNSDLEEALGPYIGPSGRAELMATLLAAVPHEVVVVAEDETGEPVTSEHGWLWTVDADGFHADGGDEDARLVVADGTEVAYNAARGRQEARPRSPRDLAIPYGEVAQHTGGFRVRTPAQVLHTLVLWHSVMHETDSGDLAPGIGPFTVELRDD